MTSSAREITVHRPKSLLQAELFIAWVLRGGVILSGAVIGSGLALRAFHFSPVHVSSRDIIAELLTGGLSHSHPVPRALAAFADGLRQLDPDVVMSFGLILLIGLPIVRVGMTVLLFLLERDYVYLAITLFVFGVLMSGIILGKAL